jgi:hypothetical protein
MQSEGFFPPTLVYGIFYLNMFGVMLYAGSQVTAKYRRVANYFNRVETQISQINSNLECMNGNLNQLNNNMYGLQDELRELNSTGNKAFEYGKNVWTAMQFREIMSSLDKLNIDWMNLFSGSWTGVKNYCTDKLTSMFMGNLFNSPVMNTAFTCPPVMRNPMNPTVCCPPNPPMDCPPNPPMDCPPNPPMCCPMPPRMPKMTPVNPTNVTTHAFNLGNMSGFDQLINDLTRTLGPQIQSTLREQGICTPSNSENSHSSGTSNQISPVNLTDRQLNFAANRHGIDINSESSSPANSWNESIPDSTSSTCESNPVPTLNLPCIPPPPLSTPPVTPDIATPTPIQSTLSVMDSPKETTSPIDSTGSNNSQTYVTVARSF